ncbi:uncharacterized protein TRIADDRAFT_59952 [Trichoplax adhaerens]|uniref:Arrestin C-terminal-like domain-containing protein n=1 Tax=Trichoplax adhaerens TaxID=10228 RepID=B3S6W3_TRIAD|nr:hypothetical protein TRIADDRAFT_59952 [Trichoplax adhaerens]EDV21381.1 hypothetical protein TRIADDRAFT_59952 [Trichoplax adhaerens]|eukprot:XP_002115981.1 hypothetical protein TRIADDRAFT_59952 [Trichoplax adhaerens]
MGRKFLMPVGRHHLKFKFQLPYNMLPSSYEGGVNCYIRYTITATMIRPWAYDYITTKAFTILEKIDINLPDLKVLAGSEDFVSGSGCFSCLSTPIKLSATTDRTGYCSGENIKVCISIENTARKRLREVVIKLIQNVMFIANDLVWNNQKVYEKIRINNITKTGDRIEWTDQLIPIPCLPPSSKACRTIRLHYAIYVKATVWNGYNLTVKIPIIIGTKPLQDMFETNGSDAVYKYRDCIDGKIDFLRKDSQQYFIGNHTFVPQYPFIVS